VRGRIATSLSLGSPGGTLSTPKKKTAIPNDKVAMYDKLIATIPEIKRKGAANPYTSLNGNMFTLLH
jgi:hypothetical protein